MANQYQMFERALFLLRSLDVSPGLIEGFRKTNIPIYFEKGFNKPLTGGLLKRVRSFENDRGVLVYAVIHAPMSFGLTFNFLYVSNYEEDWEIDYKHTINCDFVSSYALNVVYEHCSEIGRIAVTSLFGNLLRIG